MKRIVYAILLLALCASCGERRASGYYEEAKMQAAAGDAPQAIASLRRAADCAVSDTLRAAIYSAMGHLLFDTGLEEESYEAFWQAYQADSCQCDTLSMSLDLLDLGNVCRSREHDDSCLVFYSRALTMAREVCDSALVADINSRMAGYYLWHKRYDEARALLMPALKGTYGEPDAGVRFMAADMYRHTGPSDSARHYCQSLINEEHIGHRQMAHKWLAEMLLEEGKAAEASRHLALFETLTDSLMVETDMESVRRVNALYDYSLRESRNARLRYYVVLAVAAVVVLLLLLLAGILYFSRRRLHYQLRVQQLEQLLADYRQRDGQKAVRQQEILSDTPIYHHIQRLLSDTRQQVMSDEDWHILEDTIGKLYPGFVDRLWSFRRLSPQETRISLLLKSGVSPADIARLTGRSKQSVSSARVRLYVKVFGKKGSPAQWDEFIESL